MDHVTLRHQWKIPEAQKEGLIEDNKEVGQAWKRKDSFLACSLEVSMDLVGL